MKSPVLPNVEMRRVTLDEGLPAWECPGSGGHWINGDNYRAWLERHGPTLPVKPPADGRETPKTARSAASGLVICGGGGPGGSAGA